MTKDLWAVIPRAPLYEVSEAGVVRNTETGEVIASHCHSDGYARVCLWVRNNGRSVRKNFTVHRCVAEAFIPNPLSLPIVRHKDNNSSNPHRGNLLWGTLSDNQNDRREHGTMLDGEKNPQSKLRNSEVIVIRERIKSGEPATVIAQSFLVSPTTISAIVRGKRWVHVQ